MWRDRGTEGGFAQAWEEDSGLNWASWVQSLKGRDCLWEM